MKKEIMKKLEMPSKKKDPMLEMDEESMELDMPEEPMPEEPTGEIPEETEGSAMDLSSLPDEELIAELEKRGLSVSKPEGEEPESEGMEMDMEMEESEEA